MKTRVCSLIVASLFLTGIVTSASANSLANNPNAVSIVSIPGGGNGNASGNIFNQDNKVPDLVLDDRFTGDVIEKAIEQVRTDLLKAKNSVEDMDYKKRNPIKGDLQNFDVGSHKDITDLMTAIAKTLGEDTKRFSEKDPIAVKMIPIGDSGYKLPTTTEINVIGGSSIQAYPLKVDGETIGHFRVVCGGYLMEDVLINNDSVSYCVSSIEATGVSRNSGVHKRATTQVFFTGESEPYIVGKVAKVKINWNAHPKSTAKGILAYYNLDKVPHAVDTLNFKNTITMADGTKLVGTNANVGK